MKSLLELRNRSLPHRGAFATSFLGVLLLIGAPAGAEDFGQELADLELQELFEVDVVYGASKFEQKTSEAPASVTIIRAAEIRNLGYRTLADLLDGVRGFYSTYDRNYHYTGARGFSRPGDYNTRLLVLIDGHRVNDSLYDAAPTGNDLPIDLEMVQRVEVIRGPGSSLYGSSAMFGVINIVTKTSEDIAETSVDGTLGSYGTRQAAFRYSHSFDPGVELVLSGSSLRSDGQDVYFETFNKAEWNDGVAEGSDEEEFDRLFGRLSWNELDIQFFHSSRKKVIPTAPWGTVFNHPGTRSLDAYTHVDLTHDRSLGRKWTMRTNLGYHEYHYEGDYIYDYSEDDTPDLVVFDDRGDGAVWVGGTQFTGVLSANSRVTLGADVNLSPREDQFTADRDAVYLDASHSSEDWGVYGEAELRPLESVVLNLGLRMDHYQSFGTTMNPRTAVIYSPMDGRTFKLLYGQAFRAPSSYELFYHDSGFTTKPTLSLEPETIRTWEVVWEEHLGANLFLTAGGFRYEIDDLISQVTDPEDDLLVFLNKDKVEANGWELEVRRQWTRGLTGRISYGFQTAEDGRTGELLSNAPKHLGRLGLTVPLTDPTLVLGLELFYEGSRRTLAGEETPDAVLTNLTVTKSRLLGRVDLSGSVYNLFDRRYSHPGFEEHSQDEIEQDGREIRLQTSYSF